MLGLNLFLLSSVTAIISTHKIKTNGGQPIPHIEVTIEPPVAGFGRSLKVSNKMKQTKSLDGEYIEWSSFNLTSSNDTEVFDLNITGIDLNVTIDFYKNHSIFKLSAFNVRLFSHI
jgi:hypothetical protein